MFYTNRLFISCLKMTVEYSQLIGKDLNFDNMIESRYCDIKIPFLGSAFI